MTPEDAPSFVVDLPSEDDTERLGRQLAGLLAPGDAVALIGPLGAGKTRLVKAVCIALGVPGEAVNSPTFTLIQEYPGRIPIRHCDVYRLRSPAEFAELGLEDLFAADAAVLVEWADRVTDDLPSDRLEIRLEPTGLKSRRATITGRGRRGSALAEALRSRQ